MEILSFRKHRVRQARSEHTVAFERETMLTDLRDFRLKMMQDPVLRKNTLIGAGVVFERADGTLEFTDRYACLREHYLPA